MKLTGQLPGWTPRGGSSGSVFEKGPGECAYNVIWQGWTPRPIRRGRCVLEFGDGGSRPRGAGRFHRNSPEGLRPLATLATADREEPVAIVATGTFRYRFSGSNPSSSVDGRRSPRRRRVAAGL